MSFELSLSRGITRNTQDSLRNVLMYILFLKQFILLRFNPLMTAMVRLELVIRPQSSGTGTITWHFIDTSCTLLNII